jgi:DNA-binding phage protein
MSSKRKSPKARLLEHDTSATLSHPNLVFKTFMDCLKEGDAEAAREVLAASLHHLNKSHLARRYDIPRRTAYNLLSKKSAPNLELIAKICLAIRKEFAEA